MGEIRRFLNLLVLSGLIFGVGLMQTACGGGSSTGSLENGLEPSGIVSGLSDLTDGLFPGGLGDGLDDGLLNDVPIQAAPDTINPTTDPIIDDVGVPIPEINFDLCNMEGFEPHIEDYLANLIVLNPQDPELPLGDCFRAQDVSQEVLLPFEFSFLDQPMDSPHNCYFDEPARGWVSPYKVADIIELKVMKVDTFIKIYDSRRANRVNLAPPTIIDIDTDHNPGFLANLDTDTNFELVRPLMIEIDVASDQPLDLKSIFVDESIPEGGEEYFFQFCNVTGRVGTSVHSSIARLKVF